MNVTSRAERPGHTLMVAAKIPTYLSTTSKTGMQTLGLKSDICKILLQMGGFIVLRILVDLQLHQPRPQRRDDYTRELRKIHSHYEIAKNSSEIILSLVSLTNS